MGGGSVWLLLPCTLAHGPAHAASGIGVAHRCLARSQPPRPVPTPADVYSFGIVMCQLLTAFKALVLTSAAPDAPQVSVSEMVGAPATVRGPPAVGAAPGNMARPCVVCARAQGSVYPTPPGQHVWCPHLLPTLASAAHMQTDPSSLPHTAQPRPRPPPLRRSKARSRPASWHLCWTPARAHGRRAWQRSLRALRWPAASTSGTTGPAWRKLRCSWRGCGGGRGKPTWLLTACPPAAMPRPSWLQRRRPAGPAGRQL